ncbi:MAG: hypothetical protein U9O95_04900 [Candidatus Marinimicrobia bacterium]|nr:hypothetical protein [Candidatus Neomarinimicrobiota bacterium]
MRKIFFLSLILILLFSCYESIIAPVVEEETVPTSPNEPIREEITLLTPPKRIDFNSFRRAILIPAVTPTLQTVFYDGAIGDFIAEYTQPDMTDTLDGYVTDNLAFYEQVLFPSIEPYLDSLRSLQKFQAVNALTLFIYESYMDFFSDNYQHGFYRWGGDITDRDQPQTASSNSTSIERYGMDCSGFGASPFEAAVLLGILDSTMTEAAFSWFGFRHICKTDPNISDGGGRGGTTNNYRMEVSDMAKVGELIATISAGSTPSDTQMGWMQAGDVVIKSGHMGILIEINEELYFLEAGGSTVNEEGLYTPYLAKDAIEDFASSRTTTIRRCLPDKETSSGIAH